MNTAELSGKTILITGASSGIGRQVAIDCSRSGALLIITGRDADRLNETFGLLQGTGHTQLTADLVNEADMNTFLDQLPKINGLVHCAGVLHPMPIKFLTAQKIRETFSANFDMAVLLIAGLGARKKIEKKASLVFMSSISGQHPHRGNALYCSSKAAIESFSKTVALEFSHIGVRSNCLCPAMIKTPMYDKAQEGAGRSTMEEHVAGYPLGVGEPHDVGQMSVFLLSDKSRWITGINVNMDGGFMLEK